DALHFFIQAEDGIRDFHVTGVQTCAFRSVCSTESLDSSLVLNDAGSSSTSPSRFPRMLVEYQPASPSMRALMPGASTVFIQVCRSEERRVGSEWRSWWGLWSRRKRESMMV